ncbi:hypothetical protein ACOBQJ_07810 [Pelotomaculum propionicicum]|uniref:hypothetical protein n=1 Tax=Pelotomaculum propionicicum TaxID=258475 RepID=UPI003B7F265C
MKPISWETKLGVVLVISSVIIYLVKYLILGDALNTYMFVFNALGFLPINVLFVTLVINKLLSIRAQRDRLEKINMVIGMFFSEIGTQLLTYFSDYDSGISKIKGNLLVGDNWSDEKFNSVKEILNSHHYKTDAGKIDFAMMHAWLQSKRDFILRLLENPALLEHGSFTELLRAVSHLIDELSRRKEFTNLPESDIRHLTGDVNRVYSNLVIQWLGYMQYLKKNYPYLFSFAMRVNPFDENASPVVGGEIQTQTGYGN